jgi:hypothetical protein
VFYYYGAKNTLARLYPEPAYDTIIEPFAGSAAYAQHHAANHRVVLIERDERVVNLWQHLQHMSADEIRRLEAPLAGTKSEAWDLTDALVKMCAASNGVLRMKGALKVPARVSRVWPDMVARMAKRVDDIRDWTIICGDYTEAPRQKATWFIDPPYQGDPDSTASRAFFPRGTGYLYGSKQIDYVALRAWVLDLPGQVIVCEQTGARWLDGFVRLRGRAGDSQGVHHQEVYMTWDNHGMSPESYLQHQMLTGLDRAAAEAGAARLVANDHGLAG